MRKTILILLAGLPLCAGTTRAQSVVLDFDSVTNLIQPLPGGVPHPLPWVEDGFTVTAPPGTHAGVASSAGGFFPPKLNGFLFLSSVGDELATVIITNNLNLPFDLNSLHVEDGARPPGTTNYQVVISSAGGLVHLPLAPASDLSFGGAEWQNLSYIEFQFSSSAAFGPVRLDLDNITLTPIPEPTSTAFAIFGATIFFWRRRRSERRTSKRR